MKKIKDRKQQMYQKYQQVEFFLKFIHKIKAWLAFLFSSKANAHFNQVSKGKLLIILLLTITVSIAGCSPVQQETAVSSPTTAATAPRIETETPQSTIASPEVTQTPIPATPLEPDAADPYAGVEPAGQVITFWHPFKGPYESVLGNLIDEFNQGNAWGIQVEASYQGDYEDLENRMLTYLNTKDAPSLVVATGTQASTYQLGEALVDINQLINHPTWGLSEADIVDFYPGLIEQGIFPSFDGRRLTFPLFGKMNVIYYNLDWLVEMGYTSPPTTPEGFLEAACNATGQPFSGATASGRMGVKFQINPSTFADWSLAFGGKLFDYGTNTYTLENSSITAAMTFLQTLIERGCGKTGSLENETSVVESAQMDFSRGILLFTIDSTEKIPEFRSSIQVEANFNWQIAPFPHTTTNPVNNVQATGVSITKTSPKEELAAWLFLKYFSSPETQAKWVRETNTLSIRASTAEYLGDYFSASPAAQMTLDLLNNSAHPPVVPGYDQVQALSQEALGAILNGAEIAPALSELSSEANRILEEQMALIPESPDPWAEIDPGGQTITFWHQQDASRSSSLQKIITEFNATNKWGITVLPVAHQDYGEIFQKLLPVLNTEEAPNLVLAYQQHAGAYQEAGGLVDLEGLLNSARWGFSPQEVEDFFPAILQQDIFTIFDSSRLGFPIQRSTDILYYNADLLDELGYQAPPTNPEEFKEMACAASSVAGPAGENRIGYQFYIDATRFASWVFAFNGEIFDPARNQFLLNGVGSTSVITYLEDLIDSGCATTVTDRQTAQAAFSDGSLLFMVDSSFHIPAINELVTNEGDFRWDVAPLPHTSESPRQNLFGASISVPVTTPEKELASWLFIQYFTEPQIQAEWAKAAGYLPVRQSTGDYLTDYFSESSSYQVVFELLPYGITEPSLPGYDFIHQEMELALGIIFAEEQEDEEKIDVIEILDSLNATANQILAIHLER